MRRSFDGGWIRVILPPNRHNFASSATYEELPACQVNGRIQEGGKKKKTESGVIKSIQTERLNETMPVCSYLNSPLSSL